MAIQARSIKLNIQPNTQITPRINVSQYDKGVPIEFVLLDGLLNASLPSGATAKVQGTRPSGVGFSEACTIDGNILTLDSTTSMTGEAGQISAEVVIEYSGDVIGTANFFLNVERSPHPDGTIDADIIEQAGLVERVDQLETSVETNTSDITDLTSDITDLKDDIDEIKQGGTGSGLTEDVKVALLNCFENVAWIGDDGQDYYDALESALYPPANLVSISAVYSGGNVYNNATLDSLKQNLAVTAHFDNGTTQTVTNYILSGTLTTGTSTITVTYGGKTTTFTVTVVEWVTSISAVYTPSGTVFDTDDLDDLRSDLVVTATYADSTSETISDYTLTGSLEEGTSVITVSYLEKTATFNVTVSKLQETRDVTLTLTSGSYIEASDGEVKTNTSRGADLTYYDCSDAYAIDFGGSYTHGMAFYDSNKQYISGDWQNKIVAVPLNAKYFRASYFTTAISSATVTLYTEGSNISSSMGWSDSPVGIINPNTGVITQTGSDNYITQVNNVPDGVKKVVISDKGYDYRNLFLCFYNGNTFISSARSDGTPIVSDVPTNATTCAMQAHPDSTSANNPDEQIAVVFA